MGATSVSQINKGRLKPPLPFTFGQIDISQFTVIEEILMEKEQKIEEHVTGVIILEKEGTFLAQIKDAVEGDPGLKIICARVDLPGAAALMKEIEEAPDVILVGFDILKEAAASDAGTLLELRGKMPETKLIVMGERYADEEMFRMINEGIRGFFLRGTPPGLITKCIRVVLASEMWIEGAFVARVFEGVSRHHMEEIGGKGKDGGKANIARSV